MIRIKGKSKNKDYLQHSVKDHTCVDQNYWCLLLFWNYMSLPVGGRRQHASPRNWTQVIRLGDNHPYLLSCLPSPWVLILGYYVCVGGGTSMSQLECQRTTSRNQFSPFHHVDSGNQTQVVKLTESTFTHWAIMSDHYLLWIMKLWIIPFLTYLSFIYITKSCWLKGVNKGLASLA